MTIMFQDWDRQFASFILLGLSPYCDPVFCRVSALLLRSQTLGHLRPEFSASFAKGGLDAPSALCSKIGALCPIPLCGLSSL